MHAGATAECLDRIQKTLMQSRHASSASSSLRVACILRLDWRVESRPVSPEVDTASSASKSEPAGAGGATKDPAVRPAVALQPGERTEPRIKNEQPTPLPPAINPSQRRADTDRARHRRSHSLATPMTPRWTPSPPTADLSRSPMRSSRPSVCNHDCAQLEVIAEARGLQQIAFSTFLPLVAANYDVGEFSLGVTGNSIPIPKGLS